jgi:Cro/C1-type HTH DNA-binding domain
MAIEWHLQEVLQENKIANASQLEAALVGRLGVQISRVALDKLIKHQPASLRLETAQYLSTLLQVPLHAFLSVTPEPIIFQPGGLIQPYGQRFKIIETGMVDPGEFF